MAFASTEEISAELTELLDTYGLVLEGIKIAPAGKKTTLSIAVDSEDGAGSEVLEQFSNAVSQAFDEAEAAGRLDFGPGYLLEIGTPGIDAPLTHPRHWRKNRGRLVRREIEGKRSSWRVGALSPDETQVVVFQAGKRPKDPFIVAVVAVEDEHGAVVEVEFSKVPEAERAFAALDFAEASEHSANS